jgi:signal transduction histidine kinase
MRKIPFKVSARTAKLIGRENFSNAEGAIIELVKNSYDANAKHCLILFDIPFPDISKIPRAAASKDHSPAGNSIYIIDDGVGMDNDTIMNQWMEIGTGNKEANYQVGDRIKTGAKGIGRFALDRLGCVAEVYTVAEGRNIKSGYYWKMDWRQFDIPDRGITDIMAELEERTDSLTSFLAERLKGKTDLIKLINGKSLTHGTIIQITQVKDVWDADALKGLHKSLEALIPPKDSAVQFGVSFYHVQAPKDFGEVQTAYFNDFDYKVTGEFDASSLKVRLSITRNELDLKKVKKEFPAVLKQAKKPYDLATLEKKTFTCSASVHQLMDWEPDPDNKTLLKGIGSFDFTFYFLKRTSGKEEYPFKEFIPKERTSILEKFGGIRIYRDSFRVRPYGENGNDWLKLGERAAKSPAGAGQRIGDWRVGPNQIFGIINISRIKNPGIVDKSDRGALVENETFAAFTNVLLAMIGAFEYDRSVILNPFYLEGKKREDEERQKKITEEAKLLAQKMMEAARKEKTGAKQGARKRANGTQRSIQRMAEKSLEKVATREEDKAEIAQIRSLASLGLVVASFSHELKEIRNNADDIKTLEETFKSLVPEDQRQKDDYIEGLDILDTLISDYRAVVHWINYALTAIKSDKRKRNTLKFDRYFESLGKQWRPALTERKIIIDLKGSIRKVYDFRAFEVDMDTIFSNLISNSIDAFNRLKVRRERKISIEARMINDTIRIIYSDTGAGIPQVFQDDKEQIFLPFVTSKRDKYGNNIGTGLGMYLVKEVVNSYEGIIQLLDTNLGFQLQIDLPIRKKKL